MSPTQFGIVIALGGSILIALSAIIVAVIRKPVAVTDLWTENRNLRADMDAMDAKFTDRLNIIVKRQQAVGEGFIALSDTVEEAKVKLVFTAERQQKIQAARVIVMDDLDWQTGAPISA